MSDSMNLNVRISGELKDHVRQEIETGLYENVSEYVRDLIRHQKQRKQSAAFNALKGELHEAFTAPESAAKLITADDIRANIKKRRLNA